MTAPAIEIERVSKTYHLGPVSVDALREVSLSIGRGEFVAVMGPSGSGKSTLMNILGCLDRPSAGAYRLDGQEVEALGRDALAGVRRGKIGFVFQGFNLLPRLTALENVELPMIYEAVPAAKRRERARDALAALGILDREDHLPTQMSGGQQQRVAIARAIVNAPSLLLADEPTGNLDTATSAEIMGVFLSLNEERGITIVLVTHDPEIARYAKRVVRFRDGRIEDDRPGEARGRDGGSPDAP